MNRDGRPLHLLAFLGVGLAVTLALVGIDRWFIRPRPTEFTPGGTPALIHVKGQHAPAPIDDPPPNRPAVPQWAKCAMLAAWLHANDPQLGVIRPPGAAFCYVLDADVDPATLNKLLPLEDYTDNWRGAVPCVADAPPTYGDGPHACRAGDFWLCGDLELMERVKPAAESIHFGAHWGQPDGAPWARRPDGRAGRKIPRLAGQG